MENLLPPLAILLVVAAAVVVVIRAGIRRSRTSLGDALAGGPEAAAAAAARLTEAQHRSIYSLIARGQTVQAIAAYREATRARLSDARNAVLLMDRYPQPYRGTQAAAASPAPEGPGHETPARREPAQQKPAQQEPAQQKPAPEKSSSGAETSAGAPSTPSGTAGPEARSHRDAAEAPKAPESSTPVDAGHAGDSALAPGTPEPPPAVVRPETAAQHPQPQPQPAQATTGEGRPQRFPYRYRAIVSNGRQTLEVASNMLNDQIYAEIKELAHIGDTEDAAQMLCRHSDISIEDARAFVALL